jgi:hypothetical protein
VPRITSHKTRSALLTMGPVIDNPEDLPDRLQLYDDAGNPLSLGGFPRENRIFATPVIEHLETHHSVFVVWPGWRALMVQTDIPARIRLYASEEQRAADAERKIGRDPVGDHGLLFELISTPQQLSYSLSPKVDFATDDGSSNYYAAVTNRSLEPGAVTTTFNLVRTE